MDESTDRQTAAAARCGSGARRRAPEIYTSIYLSINTSIEK